ncbi:MAG: hypothetical protein J5600_04835 [Desulfovibrio sp.]|nr:hypothetical protein [Desulfovibrio sp.]MBO4684635.1 hypothetical protein [Desulfovibrio sp.]MBR5050419.1 hypothetical protein [Desulfovibrio sp.]
MTSRLKLLAAALLVCAVSCGAALASLLHLVYGAAEGAQTAGEPEQDLVCVDGRPAGEARSGKSQQGRSLLRARDRLKSRLLDASASPSRK